MKFPDNVGTGDWAETVRDPATKASEGKRCIRVGKDASASYDIAPLPDGRWAVKVRYAYEVGDNSTFSTPWVAFATRGECLEFFREGARLHFAQRNNLSGTQAKVQMRMAELLEGILVFVEPPVEPPDPAEERRMQEGEERLQRQREEARQKLKAELPLFADLLDGEG